MTTTINECLGHVIETVDILENINNDVPFWSVKNVDIDVAATRYCTSIVTITVLSSSGLSHSGQVEIFENYFKVLGTIEVIE